MTSLSVFALRFLLLVSGKNQLFGCFHPYLRKCIHTAGYVQKDGGISTYETHLLPMQPEPELESSIDALTHHYQQRRPAHDGIYIYIYIYIVVGEVNDARFMLHL